VYHPPTHTAQCRIRYIDAKCGWWPRLPVLRSYAPSKSLVAPASPPPTGVSRSAAAVIRSRSSSVSAPPNESCARRRRPNHHYRQALHSGSS
jgi:hypothetical protein